ncbi:hypothetical protein ACFVU4_27905 [Streptomyces sp. NPDC058107]|uniref:hypothetical protein n=1 Tax=Streptomyces sp. NPDC058107 TaxID=3346343 RepID=UPI0036F16920
MTATYNDTFRSALAIVTAAIQADDNDAPGEVVDALLTELAAEEPTHVIGAFLSIALVLVDCLARGGNADKEDIWRQFTATTINSLAENEGPS